MIAKLGVVREVHVPTAGQTELHPVAIFIRLGAINVCLLLALTDELREAHVGPWQLALPSVEASPSGQVDSLPPGQEVVVVFFHVVKDGARHVLPKLARHVVTIGLLSRLPHRLIDDPLLPAVLPLFDVPLELGFVHFWV